MTPEEMAAALYDKVGAFRPTRRDFVASVAAAMHAYAAQEREAEREGIGKSLSNAAFLVRRDGGTEERAKTFDDAAYIAAGRRPEE